MSSLPTNLAFDGGSGTSVPSEAMTPLPTHLLRERVLVTTRAMAHAAGRSTTLGVLGTAVLPTMAAAGDMDGVGSAILVLYVFAGTVVLCSVAAFVACRWISDTRWRAVARWLIVLLLYTPVPRDGTALPAFLAALGHAMPAQPGLLSHPLLLAYGGALLLSAPVVALWIFVSRRYGTGGRDRASHAQRASVAISALSAIC